MTATAKCHCGATTVTLPDTPTEASECNCTFCRRTGALWAYYPPEAVTIEAGDNRMYSASDGVNRHHFCGTCGMHTHGSSPSWGEIYNLDGTPKDGHQPGDMPEARTAQVNVRMIDGLDLDGLKINKLDGLNSW